MITITVTYFLEYGGYLGLVHMSQAGLANRVNPPSRANCYLPAYGATFSGKWKRNFISKILAGIQQ